MKLKTLLLVMILFSCGDDRIEDPLPKEIIQLPNEMLEISGIFHNNTHTVFAHKDSGNPPNIYEVSLTEKKIERTIAISNAKNLDWEDMTEDETFIYLGDFGNNLGSRENLKIYKIKKEEVAFQNEVIADSILFHYPDQVDFTLRNTHDFDCEALIVFENELLLFTKNRANLQTNCYALPTTPGNFSATKKSSFDTQGLITAAAINDEKNVIALLGYIDNNSIYENFIWLFYDFSSNNFFDGKKIKIELPMQDQLEAIDFQTNTELIFAGENETGTEAGLMYSLDVGSYF